MRFEKMLASAVLAGLTLCASSAFCEETLLDFGRLGPFEVGMTPGEIKKVKGERQEKLKTSLRKIDSAGCSFVYLSDVYLQFGNGIVDEIQTGSKKYRTVQGIGVGSVFSDIEHVYGKGSSEPGQGRVYISSNRYEGNTPQVTVQSVSGKGAGKPESSIQFEFQPGPLKAGSRVKKISVGAHWVEGCS
jgi:hypothetical protein